MKISKSFCRQRRPSGNSCPFKKHQAFGAIWEMFLKTLTVTRRHGNCLMVNTLVHKDHWDTITCTRLKYVLSLPFKLNTKIIAKSSLQIIITGQWEPLFISCNVFFSVWESTAIFWEIIRNKYTSGTFHYILPWMYVVYTWYRETGRSSTGYL